MKNVFLQPGIKEIKFVSEQLASYKHHILSAKEIGKSLLLGCPETSPFHQSIQAAQDTLYYINYVATSIHPSNGHAFILQRASFFTGVPEHPTPSKIRRVTTSATTTRAQAEAEQQHSEEEIQFSSPQPKSVPSSTIATMFAPGTGGPKDPYAPIVQDLYPQYD